MNMGLRRQQVQDLAYDLAWGEPVPCVGRHWSYREAKARKASVRARVTSEAAVVCATCPVAAQCAQLAKSSGYTGLAAGSYWKSGKVQTRGFELAA